MTTATERAGSGGNGAAATLDGAPEEEAADAATAALFGGPGEMPARCRALDWAATPLGPVGGWPAALRALVRLSLGSGFAMCVFAGPELVLVYNDGYRDALGEAKHPVALGRPARLVWAEVWDQIAPEFARVTGGGPPVHHVDQRFAIERGGRLEETFWTYAFSPVRDEGGAVVGVHSVVTETTERVRADVALRASEEALRARLGELEAARAEAEAARAAVAESEAKFRFALAVADLGAWDLDLTTQRAWRSPRHDQVFGYDALLPEWTYAQFLAHVVPEDRARVDASLGGALAAAAPWDFECRIRRADGQERWIAARGAPIRDAAGAPVRLMGVVQDVTAEREAEEALRAAVATAEAASRAKSEFLAVMSHELRTPLNAIGGYAELMEMGIRGPVTPQQAEDLRRIQASQRHLLGLINEVLNYAKLESGAVHYATADVPVCDALKAAEGLVAPQARARGLALAVAECPAALAVRADPDKLRQVLLNLLSNAVKFTERGGTVAVACERLAREAADGRVVIRVRDTGIGIPADKLAAVFEPFVQVRSDLTRPHEGTGLGLAISRDLARGMGGDLTAESTPGAGSTFTLTLPAGSMPAAP